MASPVLLKVLASPPMSGQRPNDNSNMPCTSHSNGTSSLVLPELNPSISRFSDSSVPLLPPELDPPDNLGTPELDPPDRMAPHELDLHSHEPPLPLVPPMTSNEVASPCQANSPLPLEATPLPSTLLSSEMENGMDFQATPLPTTVLVPEIENGMDFFKEKGAGLLLAPGLITPLGYNETSALLNMSSQVMRYPVTAPSFMVDKTSVTVTTDIVSMITAPVVTDTTPVMAGDTILVTAGDTIPMTAGDTTPMATAPVVSAPVFPTATAGDVIPMMVAPFVPVTATPMVTVTEAPMIPVTATPMVPVSAAPVVPVSAAPMVPVTATPMRLDIADKVLLPPKAGIPVAQVRLVPPSVPLVTATLAATPPVPISTSLVTATLLTTPTPISATPLALAISAPLKTAMPPLAISAPLVTAVPPPAVSAPLVTAVPPPAVSAPLRTAVPPPAALVRATLLPTPSVTAVPPIPPKAIPKERRVSPPSLHANEEMIVDDSEDEMDAETSSQPAPPPGCLHSDLFQATSSTQSEELVSPYADDSFALFVAQEASEPTLVLDQDNSSSSCSSPTPTPLSNDLLLLPPPSYEGSSGLGLMQQGFGITASCPALPLQLNEASPNAPLDMTTHNFPKRSKYAHRAAISAMHPYNRTRGGGGASVAKTLNLLKAVLQPSFNMEMKRLCDDYKHIYAMAVRNIGENTGDTVPPSTLRLLIMKMIEEAHQGYINGKWEPPSGKLPTNEKVTITKGSPMSTKKIKSEKDTRYGPAKRRRPPSEKQNDKSSGWRWGMDRRRLDPVKWDAEKLILETDFVLGVNVNKALGHAANRGKVYYLHPELFKYACDGDDKTWLYENKHLPVHGGKAFLMIYSEVQTLVQEEDCYKNNQEVLNGVLNLQQFSVPQFMINKMKKFMKSVQGFFIQETISSSSTSSTSTSTSTPLGTAGVRC